MKRFLITTFFSFISILCFSQFEYENFLLPHLQLSKSYDEYIGQRVKVTRIFGFRDMLVFEMFSEYAKRDLIYTIERVKVKSKIIEIKLKDEHGNKFDAKIDKNKIESAGSMSFCNSFMLIDKYNNYVNEFRERMSQEKFYNSLGKEVAYISNIDIEEKDGRPIPVYTISTITNQNIFKTSNFDEIKSVCKYLETPLFNSKKDTVAYIIGIHNLKERVFSIKSKLNNEVFQEKLYNAITYSKRLGDTIAHSKFKHSYVIKGVYKEQYIVENTANNNKHFLDIKNVDTQLERLLLSGKYITTLNKVIKPSNTSIRYGKVETIYNSSNKTSFSYKDNIIDITIVGNEESFSFVLKNKSDNSIKIVWDEAVFIDYDGATSKIMHLGTKYSQRDAHQPASVIISGAKIEDIAMPTKNVRYSELSNEWVRDSMYPSQRGVENHGQLRLMLPIQIKNVINEYVFVFDIKWLYNNPELLN